MYSNHMDKSFNCKYCAKSFKRKDYLKRHISKKHDNKDVFSRIRDCISTECSPDIQQDKITVPLTNHQNMIL